MATVKLSMQDKKDLDKFAKYLVYKCIQIIVQSRLGEKVKTQSKAYATGSDWFNLAIVDIPEVKAETVKVFNGTLNIGQNVCLEISLKTAEGETMVLETWWLTLVDQIDPNARVSYTIYNRMGVLLKSLFCMSRSTPAYRLSRKQGSETFVIFYRIYMGQPQCCHLGEGYKKAKVGGVLTPIGTYALNVAYRTKMLISPHTSTKDLCEDLRENHFNSELSPKKNSTGQPCRNGYRERRHSGYTDDGLVFGEPQDICVTTFTSNPQDQLCYCANSTTPPLHIIQRKPSGDSGKVDDNKENIPIKLERQTGTNNGPRVCAFHPYLEMDPHLSEEDEDIPFGSLLHPACLHTNGNYQVHSPDRESSQEDGANNRMSSDTASRSSAGSSGDSHSMHSANSSAPDDFVMVELKTPFAGPEGNSDLGQFYQECQVAPPLSMFQDTVTVEDTINTITDQLASFEASSKEFDEFVNSLIVSEG